MYYAVFLFEQAGLATTSSSLLANGLQGVVLNVFTWVNMWWIDTWGRRKPMIIGAIGMGISMMLIGVIMKTKGSRPSAWIATLTSPNSKLNREPGLRSTHEEDQLFLFGSCSFSCSHCICIHLRYDFRTDLGLCCVGLSSRNILHEYARKSHFYDFRNELVCCKYKVGYRLDHGVLTFVIEFLVCIIHPHGYEQDQLDTIHDILCHLHSYGDCNLPLLPRMV